MKKYAEIKNSSYAIIAFFIILISGFIFSGPVDAKVTGVCVNCHTMHNSQDGTVMTFDSSDTPNDFLVRGDCVGCHGQNPTGTVNIITIGGSVIPQVMHNTTDLAGGNFSYITGDKATVTADQYTAGHNVVDLGVLDVNLVRPPGLPAFPHDGGPKNDSLTCAGNHGCHGERYYNAGANSSLFYLKGSHHNNVNGQLNDDISTIQVHNSYRFLWGVKGLEDSDWQNTVASNDHNEYFGQDAPMSIDWSSCDSAKCHPSTKARPSNQTMSGFCGTCHPDFHSQQGTGTGSPFIRHPNDVLLPDRDEYSAYTTYEPEAPVARYVVPATASAVVDTAQPFTAQGGIVMCLSCHRAHASPYEDMLRWNYSDMQTGNPLSAKGCFTCHTQK